MDDKNINEICCYVEEIEIADGNEWIKLNWINKQNSDNETCQSLDVQKDSNIETAKTNDNDKVSCLNTEPEDISDGISVITESDTDTVNNTNIFQICQFNNNTHKFLQRLETQVNKQANIRNVFMACIIGIIIGIIIGFILSHFFITSEAYPNSNGINIESFETVSHNIVNTRKTLTEDFLLPVKKMLNEIKAYTTVDKKIMEHFIGQLFKIDSANKINNKSIITLESFNFDPYSLDQVSQLQISLHVLSSLAFIYDNSSLKNEISETLDIVNNTKAFYKNLMLFNNDTQNEYNSFVLKILQHDSNKIHITSKLLLSNLIKKMSTITLNVYKKYTKERYKLIKKLCDLKIVLPDDEFLKQITENNQLFKNYDKSCSSNYSSKILNKFGKKNIMIKNIKKQIRKVDDAVNAKYNKENNQKIYDSDKKRLKNERKKLNEHNYTITKYHIPFSQNVSEKICNTSQLFSSYLIEKINKEILNKDKCTKYNEAKHGCIKNKYYKDYSKLLKLLTEDEENNKAAINWSTRESDYLHSIGIQKNDISKNNFDNILISRNDMCLLSNSFCPRFNIDVSTLPIISSCKTENCINSNNKHKANSKESVLDHKSSTNVRSKQKDHSKSNDSTKKDFNNENKNIKKKKKIFSQNEIKNHMSEHTINHHKSKQSLFKSRVIKQNNQNYINMDGQSNNERFYYIRKKQWQRSTSDWYFKRAFSRRKARKYAEDIYKQNTKWLWNKYR